MMTDSAEIDAGARDAVSEETTRREVVGLGCGEAASLFVSSSSMFSGFEERFNRDVEEEKAKENDDSR
jgi:hypothetical protein